MIANQRVRQIRDGLQQTIRTFHGRVVLLGLLVGLGYLPAWLGYLVPRAIQGKTGWFLLTAMLYLAGSELWSNRRSLQQLVASPSDRLLGHILILAGVVLFPFCRFALWSQAIVWLIVLVGIACGSWGVGFFARFRLPTLLIGLSVYPRPGIVSRMLWELIFPPNFLENSMAGITAQSLNAIGWQATADERLIMFPEGAVEVGWGCNGLDMAITMGLAGLFMGLLYRQTKVQVMVLVAVAVGLAFLANIPRLMLVAVAYVYWGKQWFNFWHGFWGGQIFVGILFTIYYYAVMYIIRRRSAQAL